MSSEEDAVDLDGDGKVSAWEQNICRICLMAAITLAFGKDVLSMI